MKILSPAHLYDGVSARARLGAVHLRNDALVFGSEDGESLEWNVARVRSIHRVAGELHVEIAGDERAGGTAGPTLKLVVDDPAFEERLDEMRMRFDESPAVGLGVRLRRFGVKTWLIIAAVVIPAAWLAYTLLLPHAHILISQKTEAELGEKLYQAVIENWDVVDHEGFRDLLGTMVSELKDPHAGFDVRVTLVKEDQPNAFALPGGRIVVFSGLLRICPDADALAGVLAHEIAHVEQRHGLKHLLRALGVFYFAGCVIGGGVEEFATAETIGELSSGLVVLKHSRDREREADRVAVQKLRAARRPVSGLVQFFKALQEGMSEDLERHLAWVSTHPVTSERIEEVSRLAGAEDPAVRPWIEPVVWQAISAEILRQPKIR